MNRRPTVRALLRKADRQRRPVLWFLRDFVMISFALSLITAAALGVYALWNTYGVVPGIFGAVLVVAACAAWVLRL